MQSNVTLLRTFSEYKILLRSITSTAVCAYSCSMKLYQVHSSTPVTCMVLSVSYIIVLYYKPFVEPGRRIDRCAALQVNCRAAPSYRTYLVTGRARAKRPMRWLHIHSPTTSERASERRMFDEGVVVVRAAGTFRPSPCQHGRSIWQQHGSSDSIPAVCATDHTPQLHDARNYTGIILLFSH